MAVTIAAADAGLGGLAFGSRQSSQSHPITALSTVDETGCFERSSGRERAHVVDNCRHPGPDQQASQLTDRKGPVADGEQHSTKLGPARRALWLQVEDVTQASTHFVHECQRRVAHVVGEVGLVQGDEGGHVDDRFPW